MNNPDSESTTDQAPASDPAAPARRAVPTGGLLAALRARPVLSIAAGLLAVVVLAGLGWWTTHQTETQSVAAGRWHDAGLRHLRITGGPQVSIDADSVEGLPDKHRRADYPRRLAKIAWRDTSIQTIASVRVTVTLRLHPGPALSGQWDAQQMAAMFGPRPGTPAAAAVFSVPLPAAPTTDMPAMADWWAQVASRTTDYLGHPITVRADRDQVTTCGQHGSRAPITPVTIPPRTPGTAEATLPDLATWWTSMGLEPDTQILDVGDALVSAFLPGRADLGGITVQANPSDEEILVVMANPGCIPSPITIDPPTAGPAPTR